MEPIANRVATDVSESEPQQPVKRRSERPVHPRVTRRQLVLGMVGVAGGVSLTACSTGSSREAERGQRRDAERTSVVDEVQATRTAGLILGTPPPATPAEP